jgi:hypothetical protein
MGLETARSNCAWLCSGFLLYSLTETKMKNIVVRIALLAAVVVLGVAPMAHAQIYLNDSSITNFTGPYTTYATFKNFSSNEGSALPPSFTPTTTELNNSGFRVFGGTLTGNGLSTGNNWIEATFPNPVSTIVVFPSMDHFGSAYDGYQYTIAGSNDNTNWTVLFDATSVNGSGEPFTLGAFTGTQPLFVNNVNSGPCYTNAAGNVNCVGYEAFFDFGKAYKYYAFGASTVAIAQGNADQELSAVGTGPAAVTLPLRGNGAINSFLFFPVATHKVTYNVIYPVDFSVPANTTMTISPNVLAQLDCNGAINVFPAGDTPTCTTFDATTPANFSVIFDVACSLNGAPSTSAQCPQTTGFNPFTPGAFHSSEDISNILTYVTTDPTPAAPQMLTAHEGNNDWVAFGVGFQGDCCTRGSGGSNYNSLVVAADFPAGSAQTIPPYPFNGFQSPVSNTDLNIVKAGSTIPLKWCLSYPVATSLGFNGGPVTNLIFPPNGYLSIAAIPISSASVSTLDDNLINTQTNAGLLNLGGGCYNFGWGTKGVTPGQNFKVTLNVGDGQAHTAMFQFK